MREMQRSTGDAIAPDSQVIEVRVGALTQLFNAMDASPFRDQDLDPAAEEFIVGWAREMPRGARLALLVDLDRAPPPAGLVDEPAALRAAMRAFFTHRANVTRSRRRQLLRIGRVSLLVGLVFLVGAIGLGDFIGNVLKGRQVGELLRQGLSIIGWVAMWRPVEIFPLRLVADSQRGDALRSTEQDAGADRVPSAGRAGRGGGVAG